MIQALEHKDKTRQFDTGNHKGFLGKACTDKVELYISRVIFLFLQTDICWSNQVSKENDKMNYCTRRSFLFLLGTFLGTHFIWYQHPFFDESFQRNSIRVGARAAWGRRAPGRSASLLLFLLPLFGPGPLLVLLCLLLRPCPLLLLLLTAATMLAKSSSNSTKGCSCNCSLTSSTRTTWPMIRWDLW